MSVAPGGSAAEGADATDSELAVVLSSMCIAVERRVSESALAGDAVLLNLYQDATWTFPIERELETRSDWSLANSTRRSREFQSDIAFPAAPRDELGAKQEEDRREDGDGDDELDEAERESRWEHPKKRAKVASSPERDLSALFRLARIAEDPLEARWDHKGQPAPLRRNVLGELYAPRSNPLQFVKHQRPPASVYQLVKRSVRAELADREKRRIHRLNERHRQQRLGAQRSAEQALEAKFDRLFVGNNAPHDRREREGGEKSAGQETDAVSDSEDNQTRVS